MNIHAGFERFRGWNQQDNDREQEGERQYHRSREDHERDRAQRDDYDNDDDVRYASEEGRYENNDDDLYRAHAHVCQGHQRRERDLDEEAEENDND